MKFLFTLKHYTSLLFDHTIKYDYLDFDTRLNSSRLSIIIQSRTNNNQIIFFKYVSASKTLLNDLSVIHSKGLCFLFVCKYLLNQNIDQCGNTIMLKTIKMMHQSLPVSTFQKKYGVHFIVSFWFLIVLLAESVYKPLFRSY